VKHQDIECAVKQIKRGNKWTEMECALEARILSDFHHEGIIGFVDVYLDEEYIYLAMERADHDLHHILRTSGPFDENTVKQITRSLLQSIAYLHSHNIVHRDLKPKNIVFHKDRRTEPKLVDFGDSLEVDEQESYSEFIGTPPYMAPERLKEHKGWQLKKADVWAIACIAYEMIVGERCFPGGTQREVFGNVLNDRWSWPSNQTPSDAMQDFVRQCLNADPDRRPSAKEALRHEWFGDVSNVQRN